MIILESKLNNLTLEELEMLDPNPYSVVVNKLLHESIERNKDIGFIIGRFARELANQEFSHEYIKYKGLSFDAIRKVWRAERHIKKKRIHIATSSNREIVVNKLIKFCKENKLRY